MYLDTCVKMAGGQYSILTLLKRLDRSKYVPILFAPRRSELAERCKEISVETHWLPLKSISSEYGAKAALAARSWDFVCSLFGVFYLAWAMGRHRVDVVHANALKSAAVANIACLLARKPLVFHDRERTRHGLLARITARLARRVIVISSGLAGEHGEALRSKVNLIYDGIDTDYMSPGKVSSDDGEPGGRAVCYLGRISWEKGVDLLLEAAGLVLARVPDAVFLVAGSPGSPSDVAYGQKLERTAGSMNLSEKFRLLGRVEDRRAFMMGADVVVVPSRREALGIVLLEAMSLEKPVVAFDIEGPNEIITDRKEGLLVEPEDVKGLAEAIVTILRDPELACLAGKSGRETVISRFSARTVAERISKIYDEVTGLAEPVN
jgi:glycosyltransferase involved in cell wall biosynthesis